MVIAPQELDDDDDDHGSTASDSSSNWRKCILCDYNFNSTRRRPIILVCGHTICQECVGKLIYLTVVVAYRTWVSLMIYCLISA